MANLHGAFRSNQDLACEPARLITRVNRQFFHATSPENYATLLFGCYDSLTRVLRYVNCGHPPAVLLRGNGETERLEATGLVLGAFEDAVFRRAHSAPVARRPGRALFGWRVGGQAR